MYWVYVAIVFAVAIGFVKVRRGRKGATDTPQS